MSTAAKRALDQELRFHRHLARPGTFVDVGAHVGAFVFEMQDVPGLSLVAVEPLPHALALLRERAAASADTLRVIGAALSDHAEIARLAVPVLRGGPVWEWASLTKDFAALQANNPEIIGIQHFAVELTTLDALGLTNVVAMKLDVEGAEYEVLRGGRTVLRTMRPILSVELEERHRVGCTYAVPAFLDAFDYDCFFELAGQVLPFAQFDRNRMQRGSLSPASHDYSDPYVNCFYFLPREQPNLRSRLLGLHSSGPVDVAPAIKIAD
jgi:FkbM family methyltransferase